MGSEGRGGVSLTKLLTPEKMKEGQLEHGGSSAELWERRTASAKVRDRALASDSRSERGEQREPRRPTSERSLGCMHLPGAEVRNMRSWREKPKSLGETFKGTWRVRSPWGCFQQDATVGRGARDWRGRCWCWLAWRAAGSHRCLLSMSISGFGVSFGLEACRSR